MKTRIMGELKKVFRPELLNRIDEVIVFHKLAKEEIMLIVDLMLKRLREQMAEHEAAIELTDEAKELLVDKGYDPAMGARPLRRAIQRCIEDPLADFVLGRELKPGSTIVVDRQGRVRGGRHPRRRRPAARAREGHRPARGACGRGGRGVLARRPLARDTSVPQACAAQPVSASPTLASSASNVKGFESDGQGASGAAAVSPYPETSRTRRSGRSAVSRRASAGPESPRMPESVTSRSTSGSIVSASASASWPLRALTTTYPLSRSTRSTRTRMASSSSTSRIRASRVARRRPRPLCALVADTTRDER